MFCVGGGGSVGGGESGPRPAALACAAAAADDAFSITRPTQSVILSPLTIAMCMIPEMLPVSGLYGTRTGPASRISNGFLAGSPFGCVAAAENRVGLVLTLNAQRPDQ